MPSSSGLVWGRWVCGGERGSARPLLGHWVMREQHGGQECMTFSSHRGEERGDAECRWRHQWPGICEAGTILHWCVRVQRSRELGQRQEEAEGLSSEAAWKTGQILPIRTNPPLHPDLCPRWAALLLASASTSSAQSGPSDGRWQLPWLVGSWPWQC